MAGRQVFSCRVSFDFSIRPKMLEIQNLIVGCQQLLERGDSKLNLIQIKGVALAQLFIAFSSVDNFCSKYIKVKGRQ